MRKGRIIAVLCLTLILCLVCVTTNTFSWFTRPNAGEGDSFVWSDNAYTPNGGKNFTSKTYILGTDGEYTNEVSSFSATVKAGERVCYKTDIKNNNVKSQTVSLYLAGVKSSYEADTYLGVNNPMKTYKPFSADVSKDKVLNPVNKRDVYVAIQRGSTFNPSSFYLHWWKQDSTNSGDAQVEAKYLHKENYTLDGLNCNIYHAVVPYDAVGVKPYQLVNGSRKWGTGDISLSSSNIVCIYVNSGNLTGSAGKNTNSTAGIENFYSSATVTLGKTLDLSATGMGTLTYYSNSPSVASVDKTTGVVTAKGIGTATITVTSIGEYGDTISSSCTVTVQNNDNKIDHLPVVTNVKIAEGGDTSTESKSNVVSVYWYIKNTGTSDITFSIDKVDVTL